MANGPNGSGPTVGQLVANASRDVSALVRGELELAKSELKASAAAAAAGAGMFAAAAVLGLLAVPLLTIAAAYGLVALGLHPALAFLIVAGVLLLLGAVLVLIGWRRLKKAKPPRRTIESLKAITDRGAAQDVKAAQEARIERRS